MFKINGLYFLWGTGRNFLLKCVLFLQQAVRAISR